MVLSQRAKVRRRKVRIERKRANIYYCKICGENLTLNDKHHTMCNPCWNEEHPFEVMINKIKSGKY